MLTAAVAIVLGLIVLVWSAGIFINGAAAIAKHLGMPSLMIGMVILGFGTSAPEMVVAALAAMDGNPDLALGNALGSNIVNVGLVLGVTALIAPIVVASNIVSRELPLLLALGLMLGAMLWDGALSRAEGVILLSGFFILVIWTIVSARRTEQDHLEVEIEQELQAHPLSMRKALFFLLLGIILLIASSRVLVWGAVLIAEQMGISSLVIGLTVIALGTSLPELAASIVAALKGEHDLALGNIVGSNMFNLLAVVGIAGSISPMHQVAPEVLARDWLTVMALTVALVFAAFRFRGKAVVSRFEGGVLLLGFIAYNVWLMYSLGVFQA